MSNSRIIDDRGRLFGRFNLIDVIAVTFIVLLLPLGYAAYWLLKPKTPQILAVNPPTLRSGQERRVRVTGNDLRPFLRATVGGRSASLLVETPTSAEIKLPDLGPGSYELVLYDAAQEVARKPAAIVIEGPPPAAPPPPPPPTLALDVLGTFTGLDVAAARSIASRDKIGNDGQAGSAQVLYAQPAEPDVMRLKELPFVTRRQPDRFRMVTLLRLLCGFTKGECAVGADPVTPGETLTLFRAGIPLSFEVAGIFPVSSDPLPEVTVIGSFVGLDRTAADRLANAGAATLCPAESWGRIISLSRSEPEIVRLRGRIEPVGAGTTGHFKVGAALAVRCVMVNGECRVGNSAVAPDNRLPILTRQGILTFEVSELHPANAGLQSHARLIGGFVGLDGETASSLRKLQSPGTSGESWGNVVSLSDPELDARDSAGRYRVNAMLSVRCTASGAGCKFGSTNIAPGALLAIPSSQGILTFDVGEAYFTEPGHLVDVTVNGTFVVDQALSSSLAKLQGANSREFWGGILSIGPSESQHNGSSGRSRVSAAVTLRCAPFGDSYKFGNATVQPNTTILIPSSQGFLNFEVEEVYRPGTDPLVDLNVSGTFVGLDATQVPTLATIAADPQATESWGRIISVGPAEGETVQLGQRGAPVLPAVPTGRFRVGGFIRVRCALVGSDCRLGSTSIVPDTRLTLRTRLGKLFFDVADVNPSSSQAVASVKVLGTFLGVDEAQAGKLSAMAAPSASPAESWGRIESLRPAEPETVWLKGRSGVAMSAGTTDRFAVTAVVSLRCSIIAASCRIGNTPIAPDARIALPTRFGVLMFEIRDIYPVDVTFVDITIRGATDRAILDLAQRDVARRSAAQDSTDVSTQPQMLGLKVLEENVVLRTGLGAFSWDQGGVAISAVIRVPAQKDGPGWQFQGLPLKAGERFAYTQPNYTVSGTITEVRVVSDTAVNGNLKR